MKKVCLPVLLGLVVLGFSTRTAQAVPAFNKQFMATYVETNGDGKFVELAKEAKCNVCHYGKSKKNHNDYGMALKKFLDKDNYKAARVREEPELVEKEILEAFKKVEEMDSVNGAKFGQLIKTGELPGTAPEDAE